VNKGNSSLRKEILMSEMLRFTAWSDIHYDRLVSKCVTLSDIEDIERGIVKNAYANNHDFTLFIGDRFLKRDPEDEVKTIADRVYKDLSYNIVSNKKEMFHYHLIGNHCWTENSMKWHTSMSIGDYPRIQIMEAPCTYVGHKNFRIHALPAGYKFSMDYYEIDPECLNIFVFHDMLAGSFRSDDFDPNNTFDSGISLADIDRPEFDIVLAGDIHIPQKFNLKRVKNGGGYCGSTLQLNKGDANRDRGWLELEAVKIGKAWEVKTKFHKTRNFFTRVTFQVGPNTVYEDLKIDESLVDNQLVEVKLVGEKADVDRVADSKKWENYVSFMNARGLDIIRAYEAQKNEVVLDMTESNSLQDDLQLYLKSGFANSGNLSHEKILDAFSELS
jgi:hypothetical protein